MCERSEFMKMVQVVSANLGDIRVFAREGRSAVPFDRTLIVAKKSRCEILHLPIDRKWLAMIESGTKREEYRTMTSFSHPRVSNWITRASSRFRIPCIRFRGGYTSLSPTLNLYCLSAEIRDNVLHPEWGEAGFSEPHYVFRLGPKIEFKSEVADAPKE